MPSVLTFRDGTTEVEGDMLVLEETELVDFLIDEPVLIDEELRDFVAAEVLAVDEDEMFAFPMAWGFQKTESGSTAFFIVSSCL